MSLKTFNTIPARPKIALTDLLIRAYGMRKPVKPVGQATLNIAYCNHHLQVELQIICKYNEPTDWVSALLTAEKPNGQLRVCLDPRPLNKAIKREHFQIPMFDDVIAELHVYLRARSSSSHNAVLCSESSNTMWTFGMSPNSS